MAQTKEERRELKRAYDRVWRANNHKKLRQYDQTAKDKSPGYWLYKQAKYRSKQKGIDFNIAPEDVVVPEYCPVFGIKLFSDPSKKKCPEAPSLDRIDNTKGYVKGNVQVISWRANNLKRDATVDELEKVAAFMRGKVT